MKKLNLILCLFALAIVGWLGFAGCNSGGETYGTSVITLSQAKEIVVKALAIDDSVTPNEVFALEDQGNRDIFIKFGVSKYTNASKFEGQELEVFETYLLDKKGGEWNKYLKEQNDSYEYFDGQFVYKNIYGGKTKEAVELNTNDIIDRTSAGFMVAMFSAVFDDDAFDSFYSQNVTQVTYEGGFTLEFEFVNSQLEEYLSNRFGSEVKTGAGENDEIKMVMTFVGEDISNVQMFFPAHSGNVVGEGIITIEKYDGDVTAPDGFNADDFEDVK